MSLAAKTKNAIKWSAIGTIARYGLQLGAQIVLARLLGADSYGLFAMGMIVMTFSNFLADFGFAWGLVQNQNLREEDIRFAFTWQLIFGSVVAVGVYLLAPAVAAYFNEPRLELIVCWLSLACVINAVSTPSTNLLRRNLDFRTINIIQVSSYTIGYLLIGVPLAFNGAGVWSLVAAWLSQAVCGLVFTLVRRPHSVRPLFWYDGASALSGIGFTVFVTNILNWFLNNIDRVLLGRFLNAQAVGLYSVGYNLAITPNAFFLGALQPAFLSAGAKLQTEPGRLRAAYLSVIGLVWVLITPMFVMFAMLADDLVALLYGPKWVFSGQVLFTLALAMPAYITWGMSTPILWNTNRKHFESLLQLPILLLAGTAFYAFASQGVAMVALIAAASLWARAIVIMSAACFQLKIGISDLLPFALRGLLMSLVAVVGTYAGLALSHAVGANHLLTLTLTGLFGSGLLIAVVVACPDILGRAVLDMLMRFSPAQFRPIISKLTPKFRQGAMKDA
jgi:lipopolysaccharide exporter